MRKQVSIPRVKACIVSGGGATLSKMTGDLGGRPLLMYRGQWQQPFGADSLLQALSGCRTSGSSQPRPAAVALPAAPWRFWRETGGTGGTSHGTCRKAWQVKEKHVGRLLPKEAPSSASLR